MVNTCIVNMLMKKIKLKNKAKKRREGKMSSKKTGMTGLQSSGQGTGLGRRTDSFPTIRGGQKRGRTQTMFAHG